MCRWSNIIVDDSELSYIYMSKVIWVLYLAAMVMQKQLFISVVIPKSMLVWILGLAENDRKCKITAA